jgi:hypothetical protein
MRCHKCFLSVVITTLCLNIIYDTSGQLATLAKAVGKMRHLRRLTGTMRYLAILTCNSQQLQQRITDLELRTMPSTPQNVRDQREATARSVVERIKNLSMECKQLSDRSAQTYERITEDLELKALESQLQEVKQQAETIQAQLKPLLAIERMKRSQEQCSAQQQVHTIQSRVMKVTQRLQPIQDEACQLFIEIEGQGEELEKVITAAEQRLERPVNEAVIQEFTEQESMAQQQVEEDRAKLDTFEVELPRAE